jgi:hypothetical protein
VRSSATTTITGRTPLSARPLPYSPSPVAPQPAVDNVRRHDRLGALIHEFDTSHRVRRVTGTHRLVGPVGVRRRDADAAKAPAEVVCVIVTVATPTKPESATGTVTVSGGTRHTIVIPGGG